MAELHLRNVPSDVHERLRRQAAADGRSMSAEAIVLLRQALTAESGTLSREDAIERLRDIRQRNRLPADARPAEDLVREDRDRSP